MANLKVKENVIEAELVRRVQLKGGICTKVRAIGVRGFFDRIVLLPGGRVIFVEVKRPRGGAMAAHQMRYHKIYRELGVEACIIRRSEDIDRLLSPSR